MLIRNITLCIIALAFTANSALAQDTVNVKFSIYLVPSERKNANANANFKRVKDIHYAYGDKNIPISLKEARQSMAYPYLDSRICSGEKTQWNHDPS